MARVSVHKSGRDRSLTPWDIPELTAKSDLSVGECTFIFDSATRMLSLSGPRNIDGPANPTAPVFF